jgi:RNAse (barnase) inhibitor barstar
MEPMTKQLADAQQCGVYQLVRGPEEVERAAKEAGLTVFRIDIGDAQNKKDFLVRVAKALSFPDWFGGNWDALYDCLTDLDWLSTKTGYVLVFENGEHFCSSQKHEFDDATAVLIAAAEYWKAQKRPFWALVSSSKGTDCGLPEWPPSSRAR